MRVLEVQLNFIYFHFTINFCGLTYFILHFLFMSKLMMLCFCLMIWFLCLLIRSVWKENFDCSARNCERSFAVFILFHFFLFSFNEISCFFITVFNRGVSTLRMSVPKGDSPNCTNSRRGLDMEYPPLSPI